MAEHKKPIIHNNERFSFHKFLANGLVRYKCSNYHCLAYIKVDPNNNNAVVEERLNHQHNRGPQPSNYPISLGQQKSTLLEDQQLDCGTECESTSLNHKDRIARLSSNILAKSRSRKLFDNEADYVNDMPTTDAGDNFDSASIADYSDKPNKAEDDDNNNNDEDENESDGDSQMSDGKEEQSKEEEEEEVDGEEVGEEEEEDWEEEEEDEGEEEEKVDSSSDSEEEFIKYLPTHDPGQKLCVVSAEKEFIKYLRKATKRALARRAALAQSLPPPANLREKRSLPPPTSPIAKRKRYNLSAMVPATHYDTIIGHLIDLENLKKAGDQKAARELKDLRRKFSDIDMYS